MFFFAIFGSYFFVDPPGNFSADAHGCQQIVVIAEAVIDELYCI